jgi:hypothetical protein
VHKFRYLLVCLALEILVANYVAVRIVAYYRDSFIYCVYLRFGRQWKFKVSEVDDWIRSGGAADKSEADRDENQ